MAALERFEYSVDGVPVVWLHNRALDLNLGTGRGLLDEHLMSFEHGAFVVMPDRHTALVHPIRDRTAPAALRAIVAVGGRQVSFWDDTRMTSLRLIDRKGSVDLDPAHRDLLERIAALPEVAPSIEEEALAGSADAAIALSARSWTRGAAEEADRWCELARERVPDCVLRVAFELVPAEERYLLDDEGLRATDADRERGVAAAAAWLTHRAERGDPLAQRVRECLDVADEPNRWERAMHLALQRRPQPPVGLALGPADLRLDDVEGIIEVLAEHGGEPIVTTVGRERLVLVSGDGAVKVVLARRGSNVTGPPAVAERIREIVLAREVWRAGPALALWIRAMRPSMILLPPGLGAVWLLSVGGSHDPQALLIGVAIVVAVLCLAVLFTRGSRATRKEAGGPIRILGLGRGDQAAS